METKKKKPKAPRISLEEVKTLRRHIIVPMKKKKKLKKIEEKEMKEGQLPDNTK